MAEIATPTIVQIPDTERTAVGSREPAPPLVVVSVDMMVEDRATRNRSSVNSSQDDVIGSLIQRHTCPT